MAPLPIPRSLYTILSHTNPISRIPSTSATIRHTFLPRDVSLSNFPAAIIVLSIISFLLLLSTIYILYRLYASIRSTKRAASTLRLSEKLAESADRKQSDWLRKDSNVLWAGYIGDEDLTRQFGAGFGFPAKSRLFSVGSVSSVGGYGEGDEGRCPLDTSARKVSVAPDPKVCPDIAEEENLGAGREKLRTRSAYKMESTPTKVLPVLSGRQRQRAMSQPGRGHMRNESFEVLKARKQSMPMAMAMDMTCPMEMPMPLQVPAFRA
jgi:hypothetical protein